MKKYISILAIFSMLVFSSVVCCGFAQETKASEDDNKFELVCAVLAAGAITGGTAIKAYQSYNKNLVAGYIAGEKSVSFANSWLGQKIFGN